MDLPIQRVHGLCEAAHNSPAQVQQSMKERQPAWEQPIRGLLVALCLLCSSTTNVKFQGKSSYEKIAEGPYIPTELLSLRFLFDLQM